MTLQNVATGITATAQTDEAAITSSSTSGSATTG